MLPIIFVLLLAFQFSCDVLLLMKSACIQVYIAGLHLIFYPWVIGTMTLWRLCILKCCAHVVARSLSGSVELKACCVSVMISGGH